MYVQYRDILIKKAQTNSTKNIFLNLNPFFQTSRYNFLLGLWLWMPLQVLLASAICTKALLSRQFVEMTKSRIEGLLAAFPKLMTSSTPGAFSGAKE